MPPQVTASASPQKVATKASTTAAKKVAVKVAVRVAAGAAVPRATQSLLEKGLHKLGLARDIDLALHLPLRYEDETRIVRLQDAHDGDVVQIEGTVTDAEVTSRGRRQLLVTLDDGTEVCRLRFFHFFASHLKTMVVGARVRVRGELKRGFLGCDMVHPVFKTAGGPLATSLTPVYPTVAGLSQVALRRAVLSGLAKAQGMLMETIPLSFAQQIPGLPAYSLHSSLSFLHNPAPNVALSTLDDKSHPAWVRLKCEELLAQQLSQAQARLERANLSAPALPAGSQSGLLAQLHRTLPFALTGAQTRVVGEIAADLRDNQPMHRLLQGDVGSGKTVVAALAAAQCIDAGWQCALMAPTEILAEQHFRKLIGWLAPLGVKVAWLTGSQGKRERNAMLAMVASGEAKLVVGTHAVMQDKVIFHNLALAIIDEQHRFGVRQRLALRDKAASSDPSIDPPDPSPPKRHPHLLMMTATPIPRTLAMSVLADLDVSTIDELPPGRTPVLTKLLNESRRLEVIERIRAQIAQGRQVYWVCPLIEESEALDLSNATATHAELSAALPGVRVGLLHSRMTPADKKAEMALFESGAMGLLVSTTVIEVGVDVPNASLMVIEHAERFGLSQLHQLRGRVGRGAAASACVLMYGTPDGARLGELARERLKVMAHTSDGFEVAQRDLDIRGPGEFLGARQSGAPLLRFADLAIDSGLLTWARSTAHAMWTQHPDLAQAHINRWLGTKTELLGA